MESRQTDGESEQAQVSPLLTTHALSGQQLTPMPDSLRANGGAVSDVAACVADWRLSEEDNGYGAQMATMSKKIWNSHSRYSTPDRNMQPVG